MREKHQQYQKVSKRFPTGKNVLCEECGESTDSNHNCSDVRKLSGRRPKTELRIQIGKYKCNKCEFSTDHPSNIRNHYESMHQKSDQKLTVSKPTLDLKEFKFQCRKCNFHTSIAIDLKSHLANH